MTRGKRRVTNGYIRVSKKLLHQLFRLPWNMGVVGVEDEDDDTIRLFVHDLAEPDSAAAIYSATYESVEGHTHQLLEIKRHPCESAASNK